MGCGWNWLCCCGLIGRRITVISCDPGVKKLLPGCANLFTRELIQEQSNTG